MESKHVRRASSRRAVLVTRGLVWTIAASTCLLGATALAGIGLRNYRALTPDSAGTLSSVQGPDDPGNTSTSKPFIVIYITRYGFEPRELSIAPGDYYVMVRNDSGFKDTAVTIHGVLPTAANPQTSIVSDPPPQPGQTVDLPVSFVSNRVNTQAVTFVPGVALLDDAANPDSICRIVVNAQ